MGLHVTVFTTFMLHMHPPHPPCSHLVLFSCTLLFYFLMFFIECKNRAPRALVYFYFSSRRADAQLSKKFNSLKTEILLNITRTNSVRGSQETQYVPAKKANRLMLLREEIAVYCENHKNTHKYTLWPECIVLVS
jgi:hypothetical protein